ncbi:MAG TPA: cyclodeaminase/cyclohydrolase family protein [Gaiellaceae bacterium]|nr:cyclodeaminase/cyclohydrolase family protein [Gaiellaceae bacterium]
MLDRAMRELLDTFAAEGRSPGGGPLAALVTAAAAALLEKIARASAGSWPQAGGIAAQAGSLRERALPLAGSSAERYEAALLAKADSSGDPGERRDFALGRAFARAAEPPLQVARTAADVAQLSVVVASDADPGFQADAVVAGLVAAAAAAAAAELVAVNLTASARDERVLEARRLAEDAARAAEEARAARG